MEKTMTAKVDSKGRLRLPKDIRDSLNVKSGDVFFLKMDGLGIRMVKSENPFDALAMQAIEEHRAGETITLEEWMASEGITIDET